MSAKKKPPFTPASEQATSPSAHLINLGSRLLRDKHAAAKLSISRSTWWLGVKQGRFPAPLKLGEKTTVWRESDIDQFIASLK